MAGEPDSDADPLGAVKAAVLKHGAFLQLKIGKEIADSRTGWRVESTEHPWSHPDEPAEGFADIVLAHNRFPVRVVVECKQPKRSKGAEPSAPSRWLFLTPNDVPQTRDLSIYYQPFGEAPFGQWDRAGSHVSQPGSRQAVHWLPLPEDQSTRLDLTCRELVWSIEALAAQELEYDQKQNALQGTQTTRRGVAYLGMVVTTAALLACRFDTQSIDLDTASLKHDQLELDPVDLVRYRKSFSSRVAVQDAGSVNAYRALSHISRANERCVLIVQATHVVRVLGELSTGLESAW